MPLGAFKAALMGTAGVSTADVVLLSSQTASDSASLDFTSGIDSTYGEYIFRFYNINPATNDALFQFQVNAAGESGYNETITSSFVGTYNWEDDGARELYRHTGYDQAEGTAFQYLLAPSGSGADESQAGELHLFNPSSTTYVKHFYSRITGYSSQPATIQALTDGYFNTTTAVDEVQFKMSTGNFDGKIKMWGVK